MLGGARGSAQRPTHAERPPGRPSPAPRRMEPPLYLLTIDTGHGPGWAAAVDVCARTPGARITVTVLGSVGDPHDPHDPHAQRHAEDLANDADWLVVGPWELTPDAYVVRPVATGDAARRCVVGPHGHVTGTQRASRTHRAARFGHAPRAAPRGASAQTRQSVRRRDEGPCGLVGSLHVAPVRFVARSVVGDARRSRAARGAHRSFRCGYGFVSLGALASCATLRAVRGGARGDGRHGAPSARARRSAS